ncbi:MAG: hypothetical protein IKY31_06255 [Bacteroidaceae bacterium]|nr:hypothetical protein [Bacteroidaceae bacterium]
MEKITKHFVLMLCLMLCGVGALNAKGDKDEKVPEVKTVYLFGVAASFNDTIVHITDIQEFQGVGIVNDDGFLIGRSIYSSQLKNYVENFKNLPHRTCTIFFSEKKSDLEKTYSKLTQLYDANKSLSLNVVKKEFFSFQKYNEEY